MSYWKWTYNLAKDLIKDIINNSRAIGILILMFLWIVVMTWFAGYLNVLSSIVLVFLWFIVAMVGIIFTTTYFVYFTEKQEEEKTSVK